MLVQYLLENQIELRRATKILTSDPKIIKHTLNTITSILKVGKSDIEMKLPRERERPRGMYHSRDNFVTLNNIFLISSRYGIDSAVLFSSFAEAWQNQEATCEPLLITCRKKTSTDAIFLITEDSRAVAQFTISTSIFKKADPLKGFVFTKTLTKAQKTEPVENPKIKDLTLGMKRIKLTAKVIEISKPNSVYTRLGNYNTVATANVNDETGTIQLPLWNQQINSVGVGDIIQVENARITSFRGEPQLRVSKGGQLSVIARASKDKRLK